MSQEAERIRKANSAFLARPVYQPSPTLALGEFEEMGPVALQFPMKALYPERQQDTVTTYKNAADVDILARGKVGDPLAV